MSLKKTYRIPVYKVMLVKESEGGPIVQIDGPEKAYIILDTFLEGADRENMVVMLLDIKHKVIGINTVSIGTLNSSVVHPREVFKPAILANAAAVIIGHNHPSGDPTPSPEDLSITKRLVEAGKLLGIEVIDHIIIGDENKYVSLQEYGLI